MHIIQDGRGWKNESCFGTYKGTPLFACWENIGKFDNNVGSVLRGKTKNQTRSFFEETIDFGEKKCEECSVFPICLGGCPLQKLKNGESECRSIKYNIKDLVRIWYDYYGV